MLIMKKNNTKKLIFFKKSLLENDTMQEINLFEPVPSGPKGAKFRALGWHDGEIPAFENLQGFVDPSHKRRIIPTDESFHAIFNT